MNKKIEAIEKDMFINFYETIRWIRELGDSLKETNKMRINAKKLQG